MTDRSIKLSVRKPNLHISEEMDRKISAFRFEQRFNTEAEAIRELIRCGLEAYQQRIKDE